MDDNEDWTGGVRYDPAAGPARWCPTVAEPRRRLPADPHQCL